MKLLSVEIVYQANAISKMVKFFTPPDDVKDKLTSKAQQSYEDTVKSLSKMQDQLVDDFKENKITVAIDAPVLVIPFNQDNVT
mmetsp:Transcript_26466/g.18774  ORF Transcript_26466/g.18774 Transcript_26466/m.18774 type:complete len:83 (-) Transcript_26466:560-808(-)